MNSIPITIEQAMFLKQILPLYGNYPPAEEFHKTLCTIIEIDRFIHPEKFIDEVCRVSGVFKYQLLSGSRKHTVLFIRDACTVLLKEYFPDLTFNEIGGMMGGRDHATIIHTLKIFEYDEKIRESYNDLKTKLGL